MSTRFIASYYGRETRRFIDKESSLMRKIIRVITFMCVVAGAVIAANAQINPAGTVNVPFSFKVGTQTYSAGEYRINITKASFSGSTLRLQRQGSKEVETVMLQEVPGEAGDGLHLVFGDNNGNKYLAGIATTSASYLLLGSPERAVETLTSVKRANLGSRM